MKNLIFVFFCSIIYTASFAQQTTFGIQMGLDHIKTPMQQDADNNTFQDITERDALGFHLGIHGLIKIAERFRISPQVLLSFSTYKLTYTNAFDRKNRFKSENVFIRTPIDIQFDVLNKKDKVYLIGGLEYAFDVANEPRQSGLIDFKDSFWAGRIGVGVLKKFKHFSVSPEIVFARSITDIKGEDDLALNQILTDIRDQTISLNIKFQGLLAP